MGKELSNTEAILKNWLGQGVEEDPPKSRIEKLLVQIRDEGGGGGGETTNYASLTNKPKINGVELLGNKSLADIGVTNAIAQAAYTKTEIDTFVDDLTADIDAKQNALTFDTTPTSGSANPVTSGGVYTALAGKADQSNTYTKTEVNSAISTEVARIVADAPADFDTLKEISDWIYNHEDSAAAMNTAITNLQNSKADKSTTYTKTEVDTALNAKQNTLSFDTAPTSGSTNPVTSGGVYTALAGKSLVVVDRFGNLFIDGNQIWAVLTSAEYAALEEKTLPLYFIKED